MAPEAQGFDLGRGKAGAYFVLVFQVGVMGIAGLIPDLQTLFRKQGVANTVSADIEKIRNRLTVKAS